MIADQIEGKQNDGQLRDRPQDPVMQLLGLLISAGEKPADDQDQDQRGR